MLWIAIGVAVGVLVAVGQLPVAADVATAGVELATTVAFAQLDRLVAAVPEQGATAMVVVAVVVAVLVPGLLAAGLLLLVRASVGLRRLAVLLLVAAGAVAAVMQPWPDGLLLGGGLLAVGVLVSVASGALLVAPLSAAATAVLVLHGRLLLSGEANEVNAGAYTLAETIGIGSVGSWQVLLVVVALLPTVGAVRSLLRV